MILAHVYFVISLSYRRDWTWNSKDSNVEPGIAKISNIEPGIAKISNIEPEIAKISNVDSKSFFKT